MISFFSLVEFPITGGQSHFFLNKAQPDDIKHKAKSIINTVVETFFIEAGKDRVYFSVYQIQPENYVAIESDVNSMKIKPINPFLIIFKSKMTKLVSCYKILNSNCYF